MTPHDRARFGPGDSRRPAVLLVDDHPGIVEVTTEMVGHCGYDSLRARNGREAVEMLEQRARTISLLIADIVMPGELNGIDIAEHARSEYRLPAILITGNPDHALCRKVDGRFEILVKPFGIGELGRRIDAALKTA